MRQRAIYFSFCLEKIWCNLFHICSICFSFFLFAFLRKYPSKSEPTACQKQLWWKMLTKTHSIVTVDPFYNVFTFNFSYHSKSHSMTIMNIWTFEKVVEYNINQTVTSKKSAYMDPFLSMDTLYLTCIYSTFLFFFFMPLVFMYPERKVHSPLPHLVYCYERRPLLTYTLFLPNTCLHEPPASW